MSEGQIRRLKGRLARVMLPYFEYVWGDKGPCGSRFYGVRLFRVGVSIVVVPKSYLPLSEK